MSTKRRRAPEADLILEASDTSLVDVLDELLNKGVVLDGNVVLGVAGVDLVYLRLSSLLCAIDRITHGPGARTRRHNRGPRRMKAPTT
ncbi:MAG TPA: gas vesicle protein [Vicinamibacterales bacterium]|nr:gas vesicle protein [Vicinamibacterales bacterium]